MTLVIDPWERATRIICAVDLVSAAGFKPEEFLAELRRRYPTEEALRAMLERVTAQLPAMREVFFGPSP